MPAGWTVALLAALAPAAPETAAAPRPTYESPPILLAASELLPDEKMSGERWGVIDLVENDGFMNRWRIASDWGELVAESDAMLEARLREIDALIRLEEIERSQAFLDAFEAALTGTFKAARQVVEQPVATAKALPGGVARMFRRTSRRAQDLRDEAKEEIAELREDVDEWREERATDEEAEASEDETVAEDGTAAGAEEGDDAGRSETLEEAKEVAEDVYKEARRYFQRKTGYRRARRGWAKALGVDPYGDNEALDRELFRVSVASAAGGFSLKLLAPPTIPGLSELRDVKEVVYDLDGLDLRLRNEKIFRELGFDRSFTDPLWDGKPWTATLMTVLADSVEALDGVANLVSLMAWARDAASRDEARFQASAGAHYAALHARRPIARLHEGDVFVSAVLEEGPIVVALPVDRLAWTETWAETWSAARTQLAAEESGRTLELHLAGDLSPLARSRLESQGVRVAAHAF